MKAIRIHGPNDVRHEDVPMPEVGEDDVLVRVKAAGLCGTDLELCDGSMFYITSGMAEFPMLPGHEWSGEVVDLGGNVSEFAIGDRVTGECSVGCRACPECIRGWYNQCRFRTETGVLNRDGGFAEYISFPRYFLHTCNGMAFEESAFIEPTGVALYCTKIVGVCPNDYVAVMGPGPIGLFAVQTAKAYGARKVILAGTRDERLEVGRKLGADVTVNVRKENLAEKVEDATDGHMVDAFIEAAGKVSVWEEIASIMALRARVGMTGLFGGARCSVDFDPLVVNNVTIYGTLGGPGVWDEAIDLHERGMITAAPIITHRLPLTEFNRGVEIMRGRMENVLKVVLEP